MKTEKVLLTGILFGMILFGIFSLLEIDPTYGGIVGAILVGIIIGKIADKTPVKYAVISIFTYNLIGWVTTFLFTLEGKTILGYGGGVTGVFLGFILIMTIFYSIIGSISAFVTYNMKTDKQD
ncbi:hypothetical protein [Methanococcoides burtonii]|uniref:DUF5518 domain-containing protein n=1 Tax=Methanococcoides burtonii (strain DSM 6242 / NBRC 107633 / OCM 468 / ACE-M) TaxID=259564 RepID=Q12UE0_METBU|nr:hypothetical protein [Methanococcoides burtonii]ABE52936.1 Hypothetical protein Mbur_2060 [Methanococcoides burtonii DSM 6242]